MPARDIEKALKWDGQDGVAGKGNEAVSDYLIAHPQGRAASKKRYHIFMKTQARPIARRYPVQKRCFIIGFVTITGSSQRSRRVSGSNGSNRGYTNTLRHQHSLFLQSVWDQARITASR
jgi:hypothetical protein